MKQELINLWLTKEDLGEILSWLDRAYTSDDVTKTGQLLGDRLWQMYNKPQAFMEVEKNYESEN